MPELITAQQVPVDACMVGVGVGDGLVGLDQDHALAQPGDDLPELMPVDPRRNSSRAPRLPSLPSRQRGTNGLRTSRFHQIHNFHWYTRTIDGVEINQR